MKIQKRPTDPIQYTLEAHKETEGAPEFTLKPLSCERFDEAMNLFTSDRKVSALRFACLHGVKGWTNLDPEYTTQTAISSIQAFGIEWVAELGNKIIEISQVSETEKN